MKKVTEYLKIFLSILILTAVIIPLLFTPIILASLYSKWYLFFELLSIPLLTLSCIIYNDYYNKRGW